MCRYGIIILIIEIAGASTVILYGTNLLFNPVVDPLIEDPENPGELVRQPSINAWKQP